MIWLQLKQGCLVCFGYIGLGFYLNWNASSSIQQEVQTYQLIQCRLNFPISSLSYLCFTHHGSARHSTTELVLQ